MTSQKYFGTWPKLLIYLAQTSSRSQNHGWGGLNYEPVPNDLMEGTKILQSSIPIQVS